MRRLARELDGAHLPGPAMQFQVSTSGVDASSEREVCIFAVHSQARNGFSGLVQFFAVCLCAACSVLLPCFSRPNQSTNQLFL